VRVAVLPREVAARVISTGTARAVWAVNVANLVLAVPLLIEFSQADGLGATTAALLGIVVGLAALAVLGALVPRPWVVALFLSVGALAAIAYEVILLNADPSVGSQALFLLNRPAVSLVLVGASASEAVVGIVYTMIGFLTSLMVSAIVALVTTKPLMTGLGPVFALVVYVSASILLALIQSRQRRKVPNFEALELETRLLGLEENLKSRVSATVHDTLLNDLAFVMNSPGALDERMVSRLRDDLATLANAGWLRDETPPGGSLEHTDALEQDVSLRNDLMKIISEVQWRGLTVKVTGSGHGIYRLAPDAPPALLAAIRACLENALQHSGASVAEVNLIYTADSVTVMVNDEGRGFDPDAVGADRLGLRESVINRIESVGGEARIWSAPGEGTSVVMRVPVVEIVRAHGESAHGSS
jgi:signal transduction histidine kinase